MSVTEIVEKLKAKCDARDLKFSEQVYLDEVEDAIDAVNERRGFTPTKARPFEEKYSSLICKMALYSLAKVGVEGELVHQENGINRTYRNAGDYPDDLIDQVIPLIKA